MIVGNLKLYGSFVATNALQTPPHLLQQLQAMRTTQTTTKKLEKERLFCKKKTFEKQIDFRRVHRGNAKTIANGGIRGRAAALTKDFLRTGKGNDVVDG